MTAFRLHNNLQAVFVFNGDLFLTYLISGLGLHFVREPRDLFRLMRFRWHVQAVLKVIAAAAEALAAGLPETVPGSGE